MTPESPGLNEPPLRRAGHLLLLTRPYSWVDAAQNALIGLVVANPEASGVEQVKAGICGLAIWWTLNWVSERTQKDPGRRATGLLVALGPIGLAGGVFLHSNPSGTTTALLLALVTLIFAYPYKAKVAALGPLGPVIRGMQTALIVLLGSNMGGAALHVGWAAMGLALLQVSRTLLADVRDVEWDQHELPRHIGSPAAMGIAVGALLGGLALLARGMAESPSCMMIITISLLFEAVVIVLCGAGLAYEAHIAFIFVAVIIKAAIYSAMTHRLQPVVLLLLMQGPLLLTYWRVPRRANAAFRERIARGVSVVK